MGLVACFAVPRAPPQCMCSLEQEQVYALTGVWKATIHLDDSDQTLQFDIHLMNQHRLVTRNGYKHKETHSWDASLTKEDQMTLKLHIDDWTLIGKEAKLEANALRCNRITGTVLEGLRDPCCVGRFELCLALPSICEEDLPALQRQREARADARPAPPLLFARDSFLGTWQFFLALEDCNPALFSLEIKDDRSFRTVATESEGKGDYLGGTWGVWWAKESKRMSSVEPKGTHLWLRIERDRSSSSLSGIGGLPVRESFQAWGRPVIGSPTAELAARGGASGLLPSTAALRVQGNAYFGMGSDREWVQAGTFLLIRDADAAV